MKLRQSFAEEIDDLYEIFIKKLKEEDDNEI